MSETEPGHDPIREDPRIASLEKRIERVEHLEQERVGRRDPVAEKNNRLGNRVLAELIGGLAGGAVVGWFLDQLFGTAPWLLLVFLFMGIIVAFRNIIRISTPRPDE